jgi:hypothetical protein
MIAKTTVGQKRLPVSKKNQTRLNKRNNDEINDNPENLNDNKKKSKENIINASTDEQKSKTLDIAINASNDKIDEDSKIEDFNNDNLEKSDSDESSKKGDDDEDNTIISDDDLEERKKKSYKIVPNLQPRKLVDDQMNTYEPASIVAEVEQDVNTYCETVVGFNKAVKKNMMENITEQEKIVLCSYVRKELFRKIKFVGSEQLSMNSSIMTKLYEQINTTSDDAKMKKYLGVRYILQRQLNQKRSYCIEKIIKQMKCMFLFDLFLKCFNFFLTKTYNLFEVVIQAGTMINPEDASHFYDVDVPREYRKPWYLFVFKFLICVNGDLLKSFQGSQVKEQKNIFSFVSVSDEAFTRWVIEVKLFKTIAEVNNTNFNKPHFQKPKGQHDSLMFSARYCDIYKEVLEVLTLSRHDWNDIFWLYFKLNHPILFKENSTITQDTLARSNQISVITMDDDRMVQQITLTNIFNPLLEVDDDEKNSAVVV